MSFYNNSSSHSTTSTTTTSNTTTYTNNGTRLPTQFSLLDAAKFACEHMVKVGTAEGHHQVTIVYVR